LETTLDQLVIEMPGRAGQYNLCADAGYKGAPASNSVVERNYSPHIKQRREEAHEKLTNPGFKARRWVVRKDRVQLCRTGITCLRHDLLETDDHYSRISSKSLIDG
jgi:hypothetical protein